MNKSLRDVINSDVDTCILVIHFHFNRIFITFINKNSVAFHLLNLKVFGCELYPGLNDSRHSKDQYQRNNLNSIDTL